MAYSYTEVTSTGVLQNIAVPPYLDQAHIKVSVNGVDTTSFAWVNSNTISITASTGSKVRVYRTTSPGARLVDYTDGVGLTESALDTDSLQAFYLAQEEMDARADVLAQSAALSTAVTAAQDAATQAQAAADATAAAPGRNRLVNGDFRVDQLGLTSPVTLAAGVYGHDCWKAGAGGCTYSFAKVNGVVVITITAGTLVNVVEGVNIVKGGTHTLSWTGTAQGRINAGAYSASGVTGALTADTNATIEFGTGTLSAVQLNSGAVPLPQDERPYATEMALCMRYYEPFKVNVSGVATAASQFFGGGVNFKVRKRANPTLAMLSTEVNVNVASNQLDFPDQYGCRFQASATAAGAFSYGGIATASCRL